MTTHRTARLFLVAGLVAAAVSTAALSANGPSAGVWTAFAERLERVQAHPRQQLQLAGASTDPTNDAHSSPELLGSDGTPEIIISPSAGAAPTRILRGANGTEIGAGFPFGPDFVGGVRWAAGDVTGDGIADLLAGTGPGGGLVSLLDGNSLAGVSAYPFGPGFGGGLAVAIGDVNGDGRNDIVIAQAGGGGTVRVFSGLNYSLLMSLTPFGAGYGGGLNVATGDITGDGRADLLVGQASGGLIAIVDAATQALIGPAAPFGNVNGVFVAAGDVNLDGRAEVIAAPGSGNGPVLVFDVAALAPITTFVPYPPGFSGGVRVAATDLTGDGRVEILTAPGPGIAPIVRIYDGATFANTRDIAAYPSTFTSGTFVAAPAASGIRFTSAASTAFRIGTAGTFAVNASGSPAVLTLTVAGALPAGVTFSDHGNGSGTLSGTPAPGTGGNYPLTLTASNGVRSVQQNFSLAVQQVPVITSGNSATFPLGVAGLFTVTSSGFPVATLSVTGALPAGVTFTNNADGTATLAGTPATGTGGAYPLTLTASNGVGAAAVQSFTLNVTGGPAFTSAAATTFRTATPGSFTITAAGAPTPSITATGALPTGVTFVSNGNGTATLAGTPAAGVGGTYPLTLSATNGIGTPATQNFVLTVTQAPSITSGIAASFNTGQAGSFTITSSGFPAATISATGALPSGVTFTPQANGTATLSGTPATGTQATYPLVLSAANGIGTAATQNFTLTVSGCGTIVTVLPTPGGLPSATYQVGYSQTFTATGGSGHVFTVSSGNLPSGLALSAGGALTGTPNGATATGTFNFTVTATASNGCTGLSAYTLNVAPNAQVEVYSNGVGNTQFSVGAGTPATPAVVVTGTVLSNDTGPGALSAGPANITSTNGGQVAMSSDGTFLYTPAVGFGGPSDSFTYVLTDGNGATDTAVVTINLSGVVWYVNAASGGGGDGRSHSPFNAMTGAAAAAQASQVIYVHPGSPTGSTTLKTNQTLQGAGEAFTLNALTIAAGAPPVLQGTVALANGVAVRALSVNAGASAAVIGSGLNGTEVLANVSISGGSVGLSLTNPAGTLSVNGGTISGVTPGAAVAISGGTGIVSIGSAITSTVGHSVDIQNLSGGTVAFSAAIADTGAGILLNANTGSAITFTGGLALNTGASPAFTATAGGTVTTTQNNTSVVNAIATTSGAALRVVNTQIGSAGLTFRSISSDAGGMTAGVGIALDTTGTAASNGGLTVTGTGVALSGGTIARKSGPNGSTTSGVGIYLNNTKNASFNWMELTEFDNAAILGRDVNGFTLTESEIYGSIGTTAGQLDGPIVLGTPSPSGTNGLIGAGLIHNSRISGGVDHNVVVYNHSGIMSLQMDGTTALACQITDNAATTGQDGLRLVMDGTSAGSVTVDRCRFRDLRAAAVRALASEDSTLSVTVDHSEWVNGYQGLNGMAAKNAGNGNVTVTVTNGFFAYLSGAAVLLGQESGNATALSMLRATITSNQMYQTTGATERAVVAALTSTPGEVSRARILIANNFIQTEVLEGIYIGTPDPSATPAVDLTITNNHVDINDDINGIRSATVEVTQGGAATNLCANLLGDLFHHPSALPGAVFHVGQAGGATFRLERGAATLASTPLAVLQANNPPQTQIDLVGTLSVVENGMCLLPSAP